MEEIRFVVPGPCPTQGSMAAVTRGGKTVVIHSKKRRKDGSKALTVPQWRDIARVYMKQAFRGRTLIDSPVYVQAVWRLPKAKSPGACFTEYPGKGLDLDKLQRTLGDALEGVILKNDSRICEWRSRKVYAGVGVELGVSVRVGPLLGDSLKLSTIAGSQSLPNS